MPKTLPAIVETSLQQALVDLVDLALQGKQAHWNLHGPRFRSVHLQLDEIIAEVRAGSDEVAERLVAVGGTPDGRAAAVAEGSGLPQLDGGPLADDKVIRMFEERLQGAADRMKERLDELDETDPLSADLLIGIARGLEKQAWMLRASTSD
ncbi:Dps family protein [Georgenia thermotolerans]|uniref:DNA starvation/stationary phase protection protein n=1 Tax=Georgenia thermotolerans TaxID=527326 RepID=A0A7J5UQU7_9MICO|nr:DNA starvation/stationary phase protection protein [Georgenia thermotolerans]KAE8764795.1 DNA starvation/stationary phase protection protein [Georgenia thermotolerans]